MSCARFGSALNAVEGAIAYGISCVIHGVWFPSAMQVLPVATNLADLPHPGARMCAVPEPALIGRAGALEFLASAYESLPRVAFVEGAVGAGKTALVDRFLAGVGAPRIVR